MAALVVGLRMLPRVREELLERLLPAWLVPATSVAGLTAAALLQLFGGRVDAAATLLRRMLVLLAPLSLAEGLSDLGEADVIALLGIVLGVGMNNLYSATVLLLMVTGGEALEDYAMDRSRQALDDVLRRRMPTTARRLRRPAQQEGRQPRQEEREEDLTAAAVVADCEEVDVVALEPGDRILLREGEVVPVDCALVAGSCVVDESALTGEGLMQEKAATSLPSSSSSSSSSSSWALPSPSSRDPSSRDLLSGSVLQSAKGTLVARATRPASESALVLMSRALAIATEEGRAPMHTRALRAAALFAPLTLFAAALSLLRLRRAGAPPAEQWRTVMSILSAATNCPLSIGVPVAMLAGMSVARQAGITVKSGEALEALSRATMVVFDKTGTLTTGKPSLAAITAIAPGLPPLLAGAAGAPAMRTAASSSGNNGSDQDGPDYRQTAALLALANAVELGSNHVVAAAIRDHVAQTNQRFGRTTIPLLPVDGATVKTVEGMGVSADVILSAGGAGESLHQPRSGNPRTAKVLFGSAAFLAEQGVDLSEAGEAGGSKSGGGTTASAVGAAGAAGTVVWGSLAGQLSENYLPILLAVDGKVHGCFFFRDALRPSARAAVSQLQRRGDVRIAILSGDRSGRLEHVAAELGIDEKLVVPCLPHEKMARVQAWRDEGETVVMVGDGVNDAPALAAASVGISMGTTALASDSADVVLLGSDDLMSVVKALDLGRTAASTATRGVVGGMGCSVLQMALAHAGVVPPFVNACLQEVVDLGAILNSLRVLLWRPQAYMCRALNVNASIN